MDLTPLIATLLAKRGDKVLVVSLHCDRGSNAGWQQIISGAADESLIRKGEDWDSLESGGMTRYFVEMVASNAFEMMKTNLLKHYDWVLFSSHVNPTSKEAIAMAPHFHQGVITIQDETLEALSFYLKGPFRFVVVG